MSNWENGVIVLVMGFMQLSEDSVWLCRDGQAVERGGGAGWSVNIFHASHFPMIRFPFWSDHPVLHVNRQAFGGNMG